MATLQAKWTLIHKDQSLQRSSHTLSTNGSRAFIFGGEIQPREPRDSDVYILNVTPPNKPTKHIASLQSCGSNPHAPNDTSNLPTARVGTASAVLGSKIYYFSGRGGTAMSAINEQGSLWQFAHSDTDGVGWTLISPSSPTAAAPEPRSYHCMTSDNISTLYLHAGCPSSGRLSDLWSFDLGTRAWKQLTPAPAPPRGGTSITFLDGNIYRMHGFDGTRELGGAIDVYSIADDTWSSIPFSPDGTSAPGARSVSALLALAVRGRKSLVALFGESDPSALGHAGAGNMLPDAWSFDVESGGWSRIVWEGEGPVARGWFAAGVVAFEGQEAVIVQGGLGEDNRRLDDAWLLSF